MIALPIFLQMTLEYDAMEAGLSLAPLSLSMFGVALLAGKRSGQAPPEPTSCWSGSRSSTSGWSRSSRSCREPTPGGRSLVPLLIAGSGLGLLVSQLNNYTLSPIEEERVSEAAGVNSAGGSFGLSFGLAMAGGIMLAVAVVRVHQPDRVERGDPAGPAGADRRHARGRRRGDEQHRSSQSCSSTNPTTCRPRSSHINSEARRPVAAGRAARSRPRQRCSGS